MDETLVRVNTSKCVSPTAIVYVLDYKILKILFSN